MGDFPMMTERGTFIINGTERIVVSQLVRSPGVYFSRELDKTTDKDIFIAKIIPSRGAWLEFDVDKKDIVGVRIDRKRKQHVTVLLKALGWADATSSSTLFDAAPSRSATRSRRTTPRRRRGPRSTSTASCGRASRRRPSPPGRCSRTCSSTPSATTWRRSAGTRSPRSSSAQDGPVPAQGAAKQLTELDNPDKKGWDQPSSASGPSSKDEQGETAEYKGSCPTRTCSTVRYLVKLHADDDGY